MSTLNVHLQERIRAVICACNFNDEYVFGLGIFNQTNRSLSRCGIIKRFEKFNEFLL